jgi:hypothetical protein
MSIVPGSHDPVTVPRLWAIDPAFPVKASIAGALGPTPNGLGTLRVTLPVLPLVLIWLAVPWTLETPAPLPPPPGGLYCAAAIPVSTAQSANSRMRGLYHTFGLAPRQPFLHFHLLTDLAIAL